MTHNLNVADSSPFTVGIIQDHATADVRGERRRAERLVREAAARGAQIICLKELFNAPYFCKAQQCERFDLAEPIPGPTTDAHAGAREGARSRHRRADLRAAGGRASTATRPRSSTPTAALLGVYRKMHIPDDPLFNEKYYFTPGDGHDAGDAGRPAASGCGRRATRRSAS